MTTAVARVDVYRNLQGAQLPWWAGPAVISLAIVVGTGTYVADLGTARSVAIGWVTCLCLPFWSAAVEGRRKAADRLVTTLVTSAFGLALIPLASILWTVTSNGASVLSADFLTYSQDVAGSGGGVYHALVGTLLMTLVAALISIPIGLLTAIYLVEYADGSRLAHWVRRLVDVMSGIPSIVAGLFAYALFVVFFGEGVRLGIGGSVALSLLMVPLIARSAEEMLKLVPHELREAAYALGVPKWRTVTKVVIPTALAGIVTGVMLAIARVIGETAPLLVIAGATDAFNGDLFSDRMASLQVFAFSAVTDPGVPTQATIDRAWGAALVLLVIVMLLNLIARLVSHYFSPRGEL